MLYLALHCKQASDCLSQQRSPILLSILLQWSEVELGGLADSLRIQWRGEITSTFLIHFICSIFVKAQRLTNSMIYER